MVAVSGGSSCAEGHGSVVAILDLPIGSTLTLDGETVTLKLNDFVGFKDVPSGGQFHLLTIRGGLSLAQKYRDHNHNSLATTVGFAVLTQEDYVLVRRFDPGTEEVSPNVIDIDTENNLLQLIHTEQISPTRIVTYNQLLPATSVAIWNELSNYVCPRLLRMRRIYTGMKLIPGTYSDNEMDGLATIGTNQPQSSAVIDGSEVIYPNIPVISMEKSVRHTLHPGTKKFTSRLSSRERTALFRDPNPSLRALDLVLCNHYEDDWRVLLGDIQLSYLLFMHLHCYSSFTHWRDLVALLCMAAPSGASVRSGLYNNLLGVLTNQMITMEPDFFEDTEFSGDNFLIPSLRMLVAAMCRVQDRRQNDALSRFSNLLADRFPAHFNTDDNEDCVNETPAEGDTDGDDPVVVSSIEVNESLSRSSAEMSQYERHTLPLPYPNSLPQRFPILYAAIMPQEDVVMTCARALHDACDVTLVREAATYLEEIEAYRTESLEKMSCSST